MSGPTGYFVTGTDTGVGKTVVALALIRRLQEQGRRVAGMKPVAAGCDATPAGLRNDDALRLRAASDVQLDYDTHNPYAFEAPIAPHLTARQEGVSIELRRIEDACARLAARADCVVVEGAGGWLVPLGEHVTLAELAVRLRYPVILVVAMRLGCLNHALLTVRAIESSGQPLAGWVANCLEPEMAGLPENITTLKTRISAPLLGVLPGLAGADAGQLADCLHLPGTECLTDSVN